ncbi:MAG: thermonuclease family protein [Solirubrobacteraceae bacterium]
MSRRVAAVLVVVLAAALGARTVAGGDGDGAAGEGPARGTALVTRVVDGDTAVLSKLGRSRFIGVDTPEVYGREECFGAQASAYARRVLEGKRVRYAIGREPRDRYGRALVYVWLEDGRFFNELLVREGYAEPLAIAPNVEYSERFRRGARTARRDGRGLWERC